jgi:hypothetical protein
MSFDTDQIAMNTATEIENLYCQSWEGGRTQRHARIQLVVAEAMELLWKRRMTAASNLMPDSPIK